MRLGVNLLRLDKRPFANRQMNSKMSQVIFADYSVSIIVIVIRIIYVAKILAISSTQDHDFELEDRFPERLKFRGQLPVPRVCGQVNHLGM